MCGFVFKKEAQFTTSPNQNESLPKRRRDGIGDAQTRRISKIMARGFKAA
jgi:hypothetical protein